MMQIQIYMVRNIYRKPNYLGINPNEIVNINPIANKLIEDEE